MTVSLSALPWKSRGLIPELAKDERLLRFSHRHKIKYLAPLAIYILLGLLCVGVLLWTASIRSSSPQVAGAMLFIGLVPLLIVHHWCFHTILSESTYDIILTNKRIIYITHQLWLSDSLHDTALNQIKAVKVERHGFVQHLLNYGSLWFDTGGSGTGQSDQIIPFAPAPEKWAEEIVRAMKRG